MMKSDEDGIVTTMAEKKKKNKKRKKPSVVMVVVDVDVASMPKSNGYERSSDRRRGREGCYR